MVVFELSDDPIPPAGYAEATCHMIFDIKFDLTRKARLVLNGAKHKVPKEMTFSSVVSRDSIRIAFTLAALNGLDILAADIQNAYLSAPTEERLYRVISRGMTFDRMKSCTPSIVSFAKFFSANDTI
jgi:hypothetical protein